MLSDSLRLSAEGYAGQVERTGGRGRGGAGADAAGGEGITVTSLRQAIASRSGYTFSGHLPKEFMLEQAAERTRVALPKVERSSSGVQLPPEKDCLTGTAWNLKEEWESDEEDDDSPVKPAAAAGARPARRAAAAKPKAKYVMDDEEDEEEDEQSEAEFDDEDDE